MSTSTETNEIECKEEQCYCAQHFDRKARMEELGSFTISSANMNTFSLSQLPQSFSTIASEKILEKNQLNLAYGFSSSFYDDLMKNWGPEEYSNYHSIYQSKQEEILEVLPPCVRIPSKCSNNTSIIGLINSWSKVLSQIIEALLCFKYNDKAVILIECEGYIPLDAEIIIKEESIGGESFYYVLSVNGDFPMFGVKLIYSVNGTGFLSRSHSADALFPTGAQYRNLLFFPTNRHKMGQELLFDLLVEEIRMKRKVLSTLGLKYLSRKDLMIYDITLCSDSIQTLGDLFIKDCLFVEEARDQIPLVRVCSCKFSIGHHSRYKLDDQLDDKEHFSVCEIEKYEELAKLCDGGRRFRTVKVAADCMLEPKKRKHSDLESSDDSVEEPLLKKHKNQ